MLSVEVSRLLLFLALNALVIVNALWVTCWLGGWKTRTERLSDCFLYYISLIVVGFLVLHVVHRVTLDGLFTFHIAATLALGWLARRRGWEISSLFSVEGIRNLGWLGQILLCAFVAWFGAYIYYCRYLVPCGTDALAYHLTMPVQWLKNQDLSLVPLFTTAALLAYSPINGEIFLTWLIAPLGNDVMVRFAQMPFLVMIMLSLYAIWRRWNLPRLIALGCAGLVLVFRPYLREIVLPNVDLMLMAWMLAFACQFQRLDGSWQSWTRCGLALGLMVGTKLFGLLYLAPCLLLLVGKQLQSGRAWSRAPIAWRWVCLIASCLLLGAFPYVRNWIATGNPLYPVIVSVAGVTVFHGLILSDAIATGHHDLHAIFYFLFGSATFGMPTRTSWIWGIAVVGSIVTWVFQRRRPRPEPDFLWLWILLVTGFVVVTWKTPFLDERYLFPVFALGILFIGWSLHWLGTTVSKWASPISLVGIAVCFAWGSVIPELTRFAAFLTGATWVILRLALLFIESSPSRARVRMAMLGAVTCAVFAFFWTPFLRTYQEIKFDHYPHVYPGHGHAWVWLNQQTKDHGRLIAYAGSSLVFPLFGQHLQNSIVYLPLQTKGWSFLHEGNLTVAEKVGSLEEFGDQVKQAALANPDRDAWLRRILDSHVEYLVVCRDTTPDPIEIHWASQLPELFQKLVEQERVVIYSVNTQPQPTQ